MIPYNHTDALNSVPHSMASEIFMCSLSTKIVVFFDMDIADMYARYGWGLIPPDDLLQL